MTTELLKQARDALAKSEPTGIYKNSMTAAKRHENLIKEIDAALAQPADEDAWLVEAEKLVDWLVGNPYEIGHGVRIKRREQVLAHLRTRPAREGFVSVPVEALEAIRKNDERYRWLRSRIPGSAYRIAGVIYSEGGAGVDSAIDAAMIEAAKGGGK